MAGFKFSDAFFIDIEPNNLIFLCEGNRKGKSYVAQADDGNTGYWVIGVFGCWHGWFVLFG